jgi:hypothetical protein
MTSPIDIPTALISTVFPSSHSSTGGDTADASLKSQYAGHKKHGSRKSKTVLSLQQQKIETDKDHKPSVNVVVFHLDSELESNGKMSGNDRPSNVNAGDKDISSKGSIDKNSGGNVLSMPMDVVEEKIDMVKKENQGQIDEGLGLEGAREKNQEEAGSLFGV